jgi:3-oxo-5-alpha-steroid 4-dehydrogenase 1
MLLNGLLKSIGINPSSRVVDVRASIILLGLMIVAGASLLAGVAPSAYGRYTLSSRDGALMNARVAWVLQELPNLILAALCWEAGTPECTGCTANRILLGLFVAHYVNRTFVFPLRMVGSKPTPVYTFLAACTFCTVNGFLQGRSLCVWAPMGEEWLRDPRFILGVAIFFIGMLINLQADAILRGLRNGPEDTGYYIPTGGMFTYVSGANFFGEIVEWTGFAIACWSWMGLVFALSTLLNVAPRAYKHHRDYHARFGSKYPKSRKAVIPFVW